MSQEVYAASQAVADRMPNVGLDPVTVITILSTVLPLLSNCFNRDDEPDPDQVKLRVAEQNAKQPDRLRRRMTNKIRRESPERKITKAQAAVMAEAIIAETLDRDGEEVAAFCAAHK
jgi:hypothetical protein